MSAYYEDERVTLHHGDCLDVLRADTLGYDYRLGYNDPLIPDASVDAVVTDPPYNLTAGKKGGSGEASVNLESPYGRSRIGTGNGGGFMGQGWDDYDHFPGGFYGWCEAWSRECLRVLKPGGHMLAFGGTRTWHRLACAVEDAGFEVRDSIAWLYGSGFPKSLDVSKAIDKAAGATREAAGANPWAGRRSVSLNGRGGTVAVEGGDFGPTPDTLTAPATPDAERWQGWGTALKPSHEPVCVAVKPYGVTDILDAIGSHITRLEDECRPPANGAARSSAPTPADSPEARTDTAPESAATPHEGEQARTTPTGAAAGSSAATDTSASESEGETCWSTVTSWRACWDELYDLTSTFTTSTASSLTTDLRTLWSSIASLTVTSIPDSPTPRLTSSSTASAVDSLFAATVLRSRATLALSAPESATASTPPSPQAAGGRNTAFEPVVVARKPLVGTVAANVLTHGTGALNIDACRVEGPKPDTTRGASVNASSMAGPLGGQGRILDDGKGRWPTNVLLDDSQAAELDRQSGESRSPKPYERGETNVSEQRIYGGGKGIPLWSADGNYGDTGGASRFFPTFPSEDPRRFYAMFPGDPAPEWTEREAAGTGPHEEERDLPTFRYEAKAPTSERPRYNGTAHPTVKPLDLMRWLVRLVTPPGGTVLEPFAGSGTTVEACIVEGFRCIAIEKTDEYLPLIMQRVNRRRDPVAYIEAAGDDLGLFGIGELA